MHINHLSFYGLALLLLTGCLPRQHDSIGTQVTPNAGLNTGSVILSRQHQAIRDRAMKNTGCKYPEIAETGFAKKLIDYGLFQEAYHTIHSFKASDHLYTTGQAQALLKDKQNHTQRIAQLQKIGGRSNQVAIQELNREIASIDLLLGATHLNQALMEHQILERKWIDLAISRTAQLENSDVTYQALAELDRDLERYSRMCSDWRPRYYGDNATATTNEKADVARLRKALEDKMYAILMSGNSTIASKIDSITTFRDASYFFTQYIMMNGGGSYNALKRAGLHDHFQKKHDLAMAHDKKQESSTNSTNNSNPKKTSSNVSSNNSNPKKTNPDALIGPSEAEMLSAFEWRLQAAKQEAKDMKRDCEKVRGSNNPYVALRCMKGAITEGAIESVSITGFEKIGCGKARAAGYICDYRFKMDGGGPMMPKAWSPIETKRFVQTQGRWATVDD